MTKYIKEVIDNLKIQQDALIESADEIYQQEPSVNDCTFLIFSVIKRAVDIIDAFNYSTRTYNLTTQVPLLRLQIDNCLILQCALLLKDTKTMYWEILEPNFQLKKFKHPISGEKLSERLLAKEISNKFPDFINLYSFCCDFVHFSRKAIYSTITAKPLLKFQVDVKVGNKEMKNHVLTNANSLISVNKVLAYLIEKTFNELPINPS